jgi:RNA polymerase sigma-70 factor (ECF subfamily)
MRDLQNTQTSDCTPQDFPPPVAGAAAHEPSRQVSLERRLEFEDALSHNLPRFQRLAMRWLRNPEDAEDAVQDAMLSAFKHIAHFEGRAKMSTWLMAIVINALRMQLRRRPRHRLLPLDQPLHDDQHLISDFVADQRPTPEQTLEECELRELLIKLTSGLPPSQRMAMQLRQGKDLSIREAAGALGVPVGTLKAQLARGRATLTERLRKAVGGSGSPEQSRQLNRYVAPIFRTAASAGRRLAASITPDSNGHAGRLSRYEEARKEA